MSWRLIEFECPSHGRFEELLPRGESAASSYLCPSCQADSPRVISAPKVGTVWGYAASRGKYEPPPHPGVLATKSLSEGESYQSWKTKRRAYRRDESIAENRRKFG